MVILNIKDDFGISLDLVVHRKKNIVKLKTNIEK